MKRSLFSGLALLALISSASAADLPRAVPYGAPAAYPVGYNWTGLYIGINGGGAWARSSWDGFAVSNSPSGGMIGATAGYNWQGASPWVFGLEGDIDWTGISGSTACAAGICETKNSWFGTARGRVGYAWDRIMPYITGGAAFGNIKANVTGFPGASDSRLGWTIGFGAEAVLMGKLTAKVEYLYADLGNMSCSAAACGLPTNVDLRPSILRAGLNYRF
jgi:outer membrane immunogenic protein